MSILYPVRRAARRAFCPSLPMARESWSSGTTTRQLLPSGRGSTLITSAGDFVQSTFGKWFGPLYDRINIVATGNLLYNEAMLAESGMGVVLCIRLNCTYQNLRFIPLAPALETNTVLAWKKDQVFAPATAAFIDYARKYLSSISSDKR